jgi:hypothetical protein
MDPNERPFTQDELDNAQRMVVRAGHDNKQSRRDFCPHTPRCTDNQKCLEDTAWFLRYANQINQFD